MKAVVLSALLFDLSTGTRIIPGMWLVLNNYLFNEWLNGWMGACMYRTMTARDIFGNRHLDRVPNLGMLSQARSAMKRCSKHNSDTWALFLIASLGSFCHVSYEEFFCLCRTHASVYGFRYAWLPVGLLRETAIPSGMKGVPSLFWLYCQFDSDFHGKEVIQRENYLCIRPKTI